MRNSVKLYRAGINVTGLDASIANNVFWVLWGRTPEELATAVENLNTSVAAPGVTVDTLYSGPVYVTLDKLNLFQFLVAAGEGPRQGVAPPGVEETPWRKGWPTPGKHLNDGTRGQGGKAGGRTTSAIEELDPLIWAQAVEQALRARGYKQSAAHVARLIRLFEAGNLKATQLITRVKAIVSAPS